MIVTLSYDDLTPEQRAAKAQGSNRLGEYGFVLEPVTRTVGNQTQSTHVYRKVPDEITNRGRVVTWKRVWVWGNP